MEGMTLTSCFPFSHVGLKIQFNSRVTAVRTYCWWTITVKMPHPQWDLSENFVPFNSSWDLFCRTQNLSEQRIERAILSSCCHWLSLIYCTDRQRRRRWTTLKTTVTQVIIPLSFASYYCRVSHETGSSLQSYLLLHFLLILPQQMRMIQRQEKNCVFFTNKTKYIHFSRVVSSYISHVCLPGWVAVILSWNFDFAHELKDCWREFEEEKEPGNPGYSAHSFFSKH